MAAQREYLDEEDTPAPAIGALPESAASIVPADSIAGRALLAVIAIMTFLAALTLGAVVLVRSAAGEWQADVAREVTIQVRPAEGRDVEAAVQRAAALATATQGIASVRPYSKDESTRLLEPWLGSGLALNELPVPRLIVVRIAPGAAPDFAALNKQLAAQVPGASLDDHRGFVDRMRAMARSAVAAGLAVLGLVLAATMLSVMFATRGAMASNRPIVEVLHVVGAKQSFIAGEFQRHFMLVGLKGGAVGGGAAIVLFALAALFSRWFGGGPDESQIGALFGHLSLGLEGYGAVVGLIVLVAAVTTLTSRLTVQRTLASME
ncbi:MAG: cell division transport system permease protein [Hyphomicrobiales bacterium]|nr:cell division transport system permease protein [Hyphomicrobiales bacterium]